ncbi:MAG: hypothetical protein AAGD10_12050 [Myxococcota bacterium]
MLVVPVPRPVGMVVAFIGGFLVLAGVQTWAYCAPEFPRLLRWVVLTLGITFGLNAWAYLGSMS